MAFLDKQETELALEVAPSSPLRSVEARHEVGLVVFINSYDRVNRTLNEP